MRLRVLSGNGAWSTPERSVVITGAWFAMTPKSPVPRRRMLSLCGRRAAGRTVPSRGDGEVTILDNSPEQFAGDRQVVQRRARKG